MSLFTNSNIFKENNNKFQFDKIYSNKATMDALCANGTDGIYNGRFVLVKYTQMNTDETGLSDYEYDQIHCSNFDANGYDATVWQKTYENGQGKFILICRLNNFDGEDKNNKVTSLMENPIIDDTHYPSTRFVQSMINDIQTLSYEIVESVADLDNIPVEDMNINTKIFLVPHKDNQNQIDFYYEYKYINDTWILLGQTNINITSKMDLIPKLDRNLFNSITNKPNLAAPVIQNYPLGQIFDLSDSLYTHRYWIKYNIPGSGGYDCIELLTPSSISNKMNHTVMSNDSTVIQSLPNGQLFIQNNEVGIKTEDSSINLATSTELTEAISSIKAVPDGGSDHQVLMHISPEQIDWQDISSAIHGPIFIQGPTQNSSVSPFDSHPILCYIGGNPNTTTLTKPEYIKNNIMNDLTLLWLSDSSKMFYISPTPSEENPRTYYSSNEHTYYQVDWEPLKAYPEIPTITNMNELENLPKNIIFRFKSEGEYYINWCDDDSDKNNINHYPRISSYNYMGLPLIRAKNGLPDKNSSDFIALNNGDMFRIDTGAGQTYWIKKTSSSVYQLQTEIIQL